MAKFQKKLNKKNTESPFQIIWEKTNWLIFAGGLVLLGIGFILMASGGFLDSIAITVSPLILLLAYLVVFPLAILKKNPKKD